MADETTISITITRGNAVVTVGNGPNHATATYTKTNPGQVKSDKGDFAEIAATIMAGDTLEREYLADAMEQLEDGVTDILFAQEDI